MTSTSDAEINKSIKIIREFLDFIEEITLKIKNKATGYKSLLRLKISKNIIRILKKQLKKEI